MNCIKRLFFTASLLSASAMLGGAIQADEVALIGCMNKYKALGVTPDAALAECSKYSLGECISFLAGRNYVAHAVRDVLYENRESRRIAADSWQLSIEKPCYSCIDPDTNLRKNGYLIDLGNDNDRWMEGKGWEDLNCVAHTDGPYKRQSDSRRSGFFQNQGRSYEWFRQGWCWTDSIKLSQTYGYQDAKLICESRRDVLSTPTKQVGANNKVSSMSRYGWEDVFIHRY